MPTIRFVKDFPPIEVPRGTPLMDGLLKGGRPVASSCHGDGVCAKCKIVIAQGARNLSPIQAREQMLRERLRLTPEVRVSCQAQVLGDVTVDATYW